MGETGAGSRRNHLRGNDVERSTGRRRGLRTGMLRLGFTFIALAVLLLSGVARAIEPSLSSTTGRPPATEDPRPPPSGGEASPPPSYATGTAGAWGGPSLSLGGGRVFGRLKAEYRFERAELATRDVDDADILTTITLGTDGVGLQDLETKVTARFSKDIDGTFSEEGGRDEWIDLRDTRHGTRHLIFLSQAYGRLRSVGGLFDVTAGRQYAQEVEWAHFDGASIASDYRNGNPWSAGAFVGRRVTFWDETEDKVVAGGHVGWKLTDGARVELSDVYLVRNAGEARLTLDFGEGALGWLAGIGGSHLVQVAFRMIDEKPDRLTLFVNDRWDATGTEVTLGYQRKFTTGRETFVFDGVSVDDRITRLRFSETAAYHRFEGKIWQRVAGPLGAFVGLEGQRLDRESRADGFNASYWQPSGGLDLNGFPWRGSYAAVTCTYANYHRPPQVATRPFDSTRGDGEEDWLEVLVELRQSIGRSFTAGFEYGYQEFLVSSRFARVGRQTAQSYRVYAKVRPLPGLSVRVDGFLADDLGAVYEERLDRAEGVWVAVEYAF